MPVLRQIARAIRRSLIITRLDRPLAAAGWPLPRILQPKADDYRHPTFHRTTRRGITFDLDLSDYVQWLTFSGVENQQREILLKLAQEGDVALDIGSNIGDTLLGFAARVGAGGQAIGFEANPETLARCRANLSLNAFPHASVEGFGLGESEGEMSFGRAALGNSGADRFLPHGGGDIALTIVRLDNYVKRKGLDRIDLIKIDVEGFELNVLRGAVETIERFRPILFIELCHRNLAEQGDSAAGMVRWLEERGYDIREALSGEPVASSDPLDNVFADILCRPSPRPNASEHTYEQCAPL